MEEGLVLLGQEGYVRIADIGVRLLSENPRVSLGVDQCYRPFVSSCESDSSITLRVHMGSENVPEHEGAILRVPHKNEEFGDMWSVHRANGSYTVVSKVLVTGVPFSPLPRMVATCDLDCRTWDFHIPIHRCNEHPIEIDPFEYPFGSLILNSIAYNSSGIGLHGCCVSHNGNGYVFCGTTGVGKSTMGGIWASRGAKVIHDDRLIVRRTGDHFVSYNMPAYNKASTAYLPYILPPGRARIDKIFFVKHSLHNEVKRINQSTAMGLLYSSCFLPAFSGRAVQKVLDVLAAMAESVPVYELGFVPDESVVAFVTGNVLE